MISSRLIGLSALSLSFVIFAGCSKESAPPPTTASPPPSAPASAPSPAPAPSTTPAAPAAESSSAPAGGANAQDAQQLANKGGCLACHTVDKKVVGPAYKDVAAKYRGQPDAEAKLVQKVKNGGSGVWGQVPMPPNTQVKDEDIKTLVDWILSLK